MSANKYIKYNRFGELDMDITPEAMFTQGCKAGAPAGIGSVVRRYEVDEGGGGIIM